MQYDDFNFDAPADPIFRDPIDLQPVISLPSEPVPVQKQEPVIWPTSPVSADPQIDEPILIDWPAPDPVPYEPIVTPFIPAPVPVQTDPMLSPYDIEDPYGGGGLGPIFLGPPLPIVTVGGNASSNTPPVTEPPSNSTVTPVTVTDPATGETAKAADKESDLITQITESLKNPYVLGGVAIAAVILLSGGGNKNNG